jgi:murein DD-endopeptidase MepM/ murein hydrolase activator NlpD
METKHRRGIAALGLLLMLNLGLPMQAHGQPTDRFWPVLGEVTRGFNPPANNYGIGHRGIDIASPAGSTVRSAADGTVSWVGTIAGVPMLTVTHADGLRSTYQPVTASVAKGDTVVAGQPIGTLQAGHSVPDCLHLGLRSGEQYLDPVEWLGGSRADSKIRLLASDTKLPVLKKGSSALGSQAAGAWPVGGRVTSEYGNRIHPISGVYRFHQGIDIGANCGTPVASPWDGNVSRVTADGSRGNWIEVVHNNGITSQYLHLSKQSVAVGDQIAGGQIIGLVGTTGSSTGCHLHFQTYLNGELTNPRNLLQS